MDRERGASVCARKAANVILDADIAARKRTLWRDRKSVRRFVEQVESAQPAQRLKNDVETDIVGRYVCGPRVLDVGIGCGRVSLPLLAQGVRLTGVDSSAVMIERCRSDARASGVRLVQADIEALPFAREAFDTVMCVDTFAHYPNWAANLDEMLRVTRHGGRVIIELGSSDHVAAVARARGCTPQALIAQEGADPAAFVLRLAATELQAFAADRRVALTALVPYGAVFGSLVPNYWLTESFAYRSGALDRLISWTGADPQLTTCAQFIERRIVQGLTPAAAGRMFAVVERRPSDAAFAAVRADGLPARDERGAAAWHAEFATLTAHEPNRAFMIALLLAARPASLPEELRALLPTDLSRDLEHGERAAATDEACAEALAYWHRTARDLSFHGVPITAALDELLTHAVRERMETSR